MYGEHRPAPSALTLLSALALAGLAVAEERAHVRTLSGTLPQAHVGAVLDYAVAPGERWIVYRADASTDDHLELYAVPVDGSAAPRALCGALPAELDVQEYRLTPDGLSVVYAVDTRFQGGRAQLFSAALDGATPPVRLLERPPGWAAIRSGLQISPDSRRVVFVGDLLVDGRDALFSVALDGSAPPVQLDPPAANGFVHDAAVSADSQRVVFRMSSGGLELHSVAIDGGPVTTLSGPSIVLGGVFRWRLVGAHAVYVADPVVNDQFELFGVPVDGSLAPQRLNPPLAIGAAVSPDPLLLADPASGRVVYRLRGPSPELHSVPADGSGVDVRLDAGAGASDVLRMTAAGRVLFLARPATGGAVSALHSVPVDGSAPALVLGTTSRNSNVTLFEPSPDGRRVAFVRTTSGRVDLWATACDGSAPEVRLDQAPADVVAVDNLRVSATSAIFHGRLTSSSARALFCAPLDGAVVPRQLLAASPPLGDLFADLTPVGGDVLQRSDWHEDGVFELLRVALDASAAPVSLSGPGALSVVGDVSRFARAGRQAVYLADQELDGVAELFGVALDRAGPPWRLNDPLADAERVRDFVVSPDEHRVLFRATRAGRDGLFLVPADGSTRARKLDPDSALPGGVEDYVFTPDGRWIAFVANGLANSRKDLFVVPGDGSAPARSVYDYVTSSYSGGSLLVPSSDSRHLLFSPVLRRALHVVALADPAAPVRHVPLPYFSTVTAVGVSADSRHALFRADVLSAGHFQLCSWALDGSSAVVPLIPPHSGGAVDFAAAADGRVVFRALQPQDRIELFSVPADGAAPPTPLCLLPPARRVLEFTVSPDGRRVAYRADAETDDRYELFCRPCDGSAPAVKLSHASRRDTDVSAFAFTPDSTQVLFLADTLRNEQDDLYVVPADRSLAPRRLNPSLAPHGTLFDFRLSPDGAFVAYRANHDAQALVELFRVPIAGGVAPTPISPPPVPGGDVGAYAFVTADELLFDGDLDEDEAHELYLGRFGELRRPAAPPAALR